MSTETHNLQQIACHKVRTDINDKDNNGFCLENAMIENGDIRQSIMFMQVMSFAENNSEDSTMPEGEALRKDFSIGY